MKKILLIHGPNLNLLGKRDRAHYGTLTLKKVEDTVKKEAKELGYTLQTFQSNHEGTLIDFIQKHSEKADGILINPGALTHYSYALHDAILDAKIPTIEVHLSDIKMRESWRKKSVTLPACIGQKSGKKEKSYLEAFNMLHKHLTHIDHPTHS